jgi:hypothetical protein
MVELITAVMELHTLLSSNKSLQGAALKRQANKSSNEKN